MKRKMEVRDWIDQEFKGNRRPTPTTVRRWIQRGVIDGVQIGGRYYVVIDESAITGDDVVDKILSDAA